MKKDEMSYSGILVEKPGSENATFVTSAMEASFAADLTAPPVASNRNKNRTKASLSTKEQPRRIVKATPPPSKVVVDVDDNRNDASESPAVHHPAALASPIGANAANEMLEESIEKNAPKNKRLERVTNKQKNDREKLLQEKRRRQQTGNSEKKVQVQANPFSRFLSAFSVDANPKHKRKESTDGGDTLDFNKLSSNNNGAGDANKRLKYGFNDSSKGDSSGSIAAASAETKAKIIDDDAKPESSEMGKRPEFAQSWIVAASVATVAVLLFAIVKGGKKKNASKSCLDATYKQEKNHSRFGSARDGAGNEETNTTHYEK
eukprot:CAMPEP_0201126908 /NCGR_PEP_ID=MMETSP0850-20130426/27947_1 /ASSEMBLY_ACC=CAM_ASM_000622 /TAXON_ID=183588 /ORGANISM="Pseudo-nitzschia fraudulenta, Strain WWA7" /LENGTH=318 /DNA_ID=CAMNT_0047395537 /DNA_START=423 /DNA_END=1380 /DNA_ORIENTATION=-